MFEEGGEVVVAEEDAEFSVVQLRRQLAQTVVRQLVATAVQEVLSYQSCEDQSKYF